MTISKADRAAALLASGGPRALVSGNFIKCAVITGGAAGNLTVTGIKTTDLLSMVIKFPGAGTTVTDIVVLTSEFTISAANTINNTGGTTTASSKVLVVWIATS